MKDREVGGNRIEIHVNSLRKLCFGWKEKVSLGWGDMVFQGIDVDEE